MLSQTEDRTQAGYRITTKDCVFYNQQHLNAVAWTEYFLAKGYTFCYADVGGGVDEVNHTGDKAYYADYHDFSDFKKNMFEDFMMKVQRERDDSGGWVSLNFKYICTYLQKGKTKLYISSLGRGAVIRWFDLSRDHKEQLDDIIAECCTAIYNDQCSISGLDPLPHDFLEEYMNAYFK